VGSPLIGDVVVVPFPYADLTGFKKRPAVVIARGDRGDIVLCQITSRPYASTTALPLAATDFQDGGLPITSYARPMKLFTASDSLIIRTAGSLREETVGRIRRALIALLDATA
jgi:mRNA interferase MazF